MAESPFDEASWREKLLRNRAGTLATFRDPRTSPFAVIRRADFAGAAPDWKPLVVGSAESSDVALEGLPAHALSVHARPDSFELEAIGSDSNFSVLGKSNSGEPFAEGPPVQRAKLGPGGRIKLGRYLLRFSHQNFPAVLVYDPEKAELSKAAMPVWFEPDPGWRLIARLEKDPQPREEIVQSTRGSKRHGLRIGALVFRAPGSEQDQRLTAIRLLEPGAGESGFSIFFRDATTGHESYPVGRYLEPELLDGDRWLVDFNGCYNPACAYSTMFNCPIPPRENKLAIAIRAGERDPHPGEH